MYQKGFRNKKNALAFRQAQTKHTEYAEATTSSYPPGWHGDGRIGRPPDTQYPRTLVARGRQRERRFRAVDSARGRWTLKHHYLASLFVC